MDKDDVKEALSSIIFECECQSDEDGEGVLNWAESLEVGDRLFAEMERLIQEYKDDKER